MFANRSQPWRSASWWALISALLHVTLLFSLRARPPEPDGPAFELPDLVEFGIADAPLGTEGAPGGGAAAAASATTPEPTPEPPKPEPKRRAPKPVAPVVDQGTVAVAAAGTPDAGAEQAEPDAPANPLESAAAVSGMFGAGSGEGQGFGGNGTGSGAGGATIALNVDLDRVRSSALLLETQALLDILPEWQALLAGSGLDAVRDFRRVFVAAPSLDRASLVVSAEHGLTRAQISAAVGTLAAERGNAAPFRVERGMPVAAWRNRGPTERVVALPASDQLLITRSGELERVLNVSRALAAVRLDQGFAENELKTRGGLLAMKPDEAVALWVENLRRYIRSAPTATPDSARMSIFRVDQFNTGLTLTGHYPSSTAAAAARSELDGWRATLSDHPRVIFLGLKSALDNAQIEQDGRTLRLRVRLTLHQTRYLMAYVSRLFRPRAS